MSDAPTRTISFPHDVVVHEDVRIRMSDGIELSARLWLPVVAREQPVPAVVEYIPYRKRDGTRARDQLHHPYLAGHGYACLRIDLRGSGDSGGVLTDEYLEQELADGEEALRWIAEQDWCDGSIGIMGISWGGFNGLQLAARRPPELRAVVTVASTDDRYADDVHYMGGCLLGDNLSWASTMFSYNSLPPDPALRPDWRERWMERLEGSGLWLDTWLRHQHRDEYWRHGSICEDWPAIEVPVMAVSGWSDGYTNAVFRMLEHLRVPRLGLVGPWSHRYPHIGSPGPAIDWLAELVRWWDRWLKGERNGIEDEPMLRAYLQDSVAPFTSYEHRPGRWVTAESWPSTDVEYETRWLAPGRLLPAPPEEDEPLRVHSPLTVGLFAGKWCSYASAPDLPGDQQEEDGGSLTFDSPFLEQDLELLGQPVLELQVSSDVPVAMVAVRLGDIRPDNQVSRVTYGLLNLTHRDSHADPSPLSPGEPVTVRVALNDVGHVFLAGHRLRVSVSTSYWPLAWLPPEPVTLTVHPRGCRLHLPIRHAGAGAGLDLGRPVTASPEAVTQLEPGEATWRVLRDLATDTSTLEVIRDEGTRRLEAIGTVSHLRAEERYHVTGADVSSACAETVWDRGLRRGDWSVRTVTTTRLTCDADAFHVHATLDAFEDGRRVHARNWQRSIERRLV